MLQIKNVQCNSEVVRWFSRKGLWTTKFAMDAHSNWSQNQPFLGKLEVQFTIVALELGMTQSLEILDSCTHPTYTSTKHPPKK